jgi:hypothetical protein
MLAILDGLKISERTIFQSDTVDTGGNRAGDILTGAVRLAGSDWNRASHPHF